MTEPAVAPETPDVAEIVGFLRRFADLMTNGQNGTYLRQAADLLDTLTVRVIAASDDAGLSRYRHKPLTQHTDALEAEHESRKNDIEGQLEIASSLLAARDTLGGMLQAREAELAALREALSREREAQKAALEARVEEYGRLRRELEPEREASEARLAARERGELQARLKAHDEELATLRMVAGREHDAPKAKVSALEAKRGGLRSAFDRINALRDRTIAPQAGVEAVPLAVLPNGQGAAAGEVNAVVPITTLRQARAQFEYLAREFIPLGDIASRVMCGLGAYTLDMALIGGRPNDHLPVAEVVRSILAPAGPSRI